MKLSCGVVLLNESNQVFLCHCTGMIYWDLPKGIGDPGEEPRVTAARETLEETGLVIPAERLLDLGEFVYQPKKHLHLFALRVADDAVPISDCRCRSMFLHPSTGKPTPEVDGYGWCELEEIRSRCGKNMTRVLTGLHWEQVRALPETSQLQVRDIPVLVEASEGVFDQPLPPRA